VLENIFFGVNQANGSSETRSSVTARCVHLE
jgi:hypothetical protein